MNIKSINFLFFIIVLFILYFSFSNSNNQRYVLLIANTFFIINVSGIKSLIIIAIETCIVYYSAILIEKYNKDNNTKKSKSVLLSSLFLILLILCFFKFFRDAYNRFVSLNEAYSNILQLVMPIGISYFTLTMIGYLIDIYHSKYVPEKSFIDFYIFITYFPSIIEGPINSYKNVAYQIKEKHEFNQELTTLGMQRIIWGYIKKIVIADRIGIIVTTISQDYNSSGFLLFWAMLLYSFQIYADFSGGIDIIMGISKILGINLSENFDSPLMSKSITEYWQRWHISLGKFMEKYLYYPVVLNKKVLAFSKKINNNYLKKVFSATLASVVVFIIVGVWHGTGWNYVLYGCYQAFFVSAAILLKPMYSRINKMLRINNNSFFIKMFRIIRTFLILTIGRFFIKFNDLAVVFKSFGRLLSKFHFNEINVIYHGIYGLDYKNLIVMYIGILSLVIVDILHFRNISIRKWLNSKTLLMRYIVYLIALFSIIIFGIYGPEFTMSSFIYEGF